MPIQKAGEILHKSIKNFICIDDEFVEPFQVPTKEDDNIEFTQQLYTSFHKNYKNLKVIKFKAESTVEEVVPYFDNADIVILDWQLGHHKIQTTVSILTQAIQSSHVKYIFIYTNDKDESSPQGLEEIRKNLVLSFYKDYQTSDAIDKLRDLVITKDILEEEEISNYLANIEGILFSYLFGQLTVGQLRRQLFIDLEKINESLEMKDVCSLMKENEVDFINILLASLRKKFELEEDQFSVDFQIKNLDKDIYIADNKLVTIVSKKAQDTTPDKLLNKIYTFIASEYDSYFNILSHEIMHHFKQNFLSRAKSFARIDNQIIKSHINYKGTEGSKLSLKELVDGVYSEIFKSVLKNNRLDYIEVADVFFDGLDDTSGIDIKEQIKYLNSLISIDHIISNMHSYRNDFQIAFGDIFKVSAGNNGDIYAICVTPHCDCAHPGIDQEFRFVFSSSVQEDISLSETNFDSDFCTFLPIFEKESVDGKIKIIHWKSDSVESFVKTKSLGLFSENDIRKEIFAKALPDKDYSFTFVAQQKESFTQRLLNESARHSIRVGVSYVNIKTDESCSVE